MHVALGEDSVKVKRVQSREDTEQAYPCATESPIPFWADGVPLSREWFAENLGRAVEGFHLLDEDGKTIGHIYWAPSEQALVPYEIEGKVACVYCEWVQRCHRGKGGMHLLFHEFVTFLSSQGYKGILVRGTEIATYMHYRHFLKRGFQVIRRGDGGRLLYYPLSQTSVAIKPIVPRVFKEGRAEVEILVIGSHFCPVAASAALAIRRVAQSLGARVSVKEVPAGREAIMQYGVANGIFINGQEKLLGPVSESQVRKAIEEELKKTA